MKWILDNRELLAERTLQHLRIAVLPILLSFFISLPIGWFAARFRRSYAPLVTVFGLLYAIPSLPFFIALPAILGTGLRDSRNVIVALTVYGVALMARASADGLRSVDDDILRAGSAMGFSEWAQFWKVQLPLAGPVLLAGLRVVAVSTVSLTTVGAVLGVKSLGLLFTDGAQRDIPEEIIAGIIITVALAAAIDGVLVGIGSILMPWRAALS
jgi:osmoprotectant transport system permease protein